METRSLRCASFFAIVVIFVIVLIYYKYGASEKSFEMRINRKNTNLNAPSKELLAETLDEVYAEVENLMRTSTLHLPRQELKHVLNQLDIAVKDLPSVTVSKRSKATPVPRVLAKNDVCQEKYAYDKLSGDYPYFYKGFNMLECTDVPKFQTILTLVYNCVHYSESNLKLVPKLLDDIHKLYPQMNVLLALPFTYTVDESKYTQVKFYKFEISSSGTDIWNKLISQVNTKYVYIGRNVIHFTWFDRLERLVREINSLNAVVVAAAFRTLHSGHWSNGCDQSLISDYTLVYRHGYYRSMEECLKCDYVHGPFVAKTELFKQNALHKNVTETSGFAAFFLERKQKKELVMACPDSMAFITDESRQVKLSQWRHLARLMQIERIHLTNGAVMKFSCEEAGTGCESAAGKGLMTSRCCRDSLLQISKEILKNCVEAGLACQIEESALLGALKFNSLLPWEATSTIHLHKQNFTAFQQTVIPKLQDLGYKVESKLIWKSYTIRSSRASVNVHTTANIDSVFKNMKHTTILYEGFAAPTPENPALSAKSRYGSDLLQHTQDRRSIGSNSKNSVQSYGFLECSKPGHHACLDQYIADGSIQFRRPIN